MLLLTLEKSNEVIYFLKEINAERKKSKQRGAGQKSSAAEPFGVGWTGPRSVTGASCHTSPSWCLETPPPACPIQALCWRDSPTVKFNSDWPGVWASLHFTSAEMEHLGSIHFLWSGWAERGLFLQLESFLLKGF